MTNLTENESLWIISGNCVTEAELAERPPLWLLADTKKSLSTPSISLNPGKTIEGHLRSSPNCMNTFHAVFLLALARLAMVWMPNGVGYALIVLKAILPSARSSTAPFPVGKPRSFVRKFATHW